ncbi:MAG: NAD-dependent epimerase/dehydratase family protein [Acidobacteria bacterium]|mgnify:CR=1 FL=1|nr:MAG: NAD-dependent epimerase/dehydratase family protein [Acidobacteriota bacterium]REK04387.1 MAG: NAD-dependent epimerase/dehydratase family protein [Acidobacteriota bacterium]
MSAVDDAASQTARDLRDRRDLALVGRDRLLFENDLQRHAAELDAGVRDRRFLVVGGAGSIGRAVVRELFKRQPAALHVVDLSENGLAELVRDLRSSLGYLAQGGDFQAYCFDALGPELAALESAQSHTKPYDVVLNFSALKHVRSEKDPLTLMRMLRVNLLVTSRTLELARRCGATKYFCVSTDKAANPVSVMGASKSVMESLLVHRGQGVPISTARFANVLFSDGSLPDSWRRRQARGQPLVAPRDVRRYFVVEREAGLLCLFSTLLGQDREIFFPRLDPARHLVNFGDLLLRFLEAQGLEPREAASENEARALAAERPEDAPWWPIHRFDSDTSGEKEQEEFFADGESVDLERFAEIGIVTNHPKVDRETLDAFLTELDRLLESRTWTQPQLLDLMHRTLPFAHRVEERNLDQKM